LKDIEGLEIMPSPLINRGYGVRSPMTVEAFAFSPSPDSGNEAGPATGFRTGQRVRHPSIGPGRIEQIMPDGERSRVVIQFDAGARLTLVLKFARLEPLEDGGSQK
jgi:hypothetical protein